MLAKGQHAPGLKSGSGKLNIFLLILLFLFVWVIFKWQQCDWTSIHLAGNFHMTGQ